jgi:phospholipase/carboxylesterase
MKARISASKARSLIEAHRLLVAGTPLADAEKVALLIHGRHASAEVVLPLAERLTVPGVCFLAPSAATGSWYPGLFMGPIAANEPFLSQSLDRLGAILRSVNDLGFDVGTEIVLTGFSQGACLVLEFAARHPRRYAGVLGFTGGLIGPDPLRRKETGSFEGTPVFVGCSERDPFIPAQRVVETAEHLKANGALVTMRFYPGSDHIITDDQIAHGLEILSSGARPGEVASLRRKGFAPT